MSRSNVFRSSRIRKAALGITAAAAVSVGVGFGVAHAVTGSHPTGPVTPASSSVDRPEPGDTPDAPGAVADRPDVPGQPDLPEPGDTPDTPGESADQPDVPGQPDLPEPGDTPDQTR